MSKAKKEAERIVEMYWDDFCPKDHFPNNNYCQCNSLTQIQAIQCALIYVEGIIEALSEIKDIHVIGNSLIDEIENWQEVLTILKDK